MTYSERFTAAELEKIINAGIIYMCACPAMVADSVRKLREMYRYQLNCLEDPENCSAVHQSIARNTAIAHAQMQDCWTRYWCLKNGIAPPWTCPQACASGKPRKCWRTEPAASRHHKSPELVGVKAVTPP